MISSDLAQKIKRIQITTNKIVNQVMAGQYQSAFKGRGMEFSEVREYIPGDDIRTIDWNVTARFNKPFVKRYQEERELTVMFLNDISGSQYFGTSKQLKSELSAEICAILAFSAIKNNDRVGSILFSDRIESYIPPQKGTQHVLRVVRDLLFKQPEGHQTNIGTALEYLMKVQKKRAVVFLVTDFMDQAFEKTLRIAAKKHDLVSFIVEDPRELALPAAGWAYLNDPESGQIAMVDLSNNNLRSQFTQQITAAHEKRDHFLSASGIDFLKIRTDVPYEVPLYRFLKNRAKRMH